jgi:uncharacterized protein YkwD
MRFACLKVRTAVVLAALCAVVLGAAPAAHATRACGSAKAMPSKVSKRTIVRATLCLLNAERSRHGLRPLRANQKLAKAARGHAKDMAKHNYFDHNSRSGATFVDRIRNAGYLAGAHSWTVGENLAWGAGSRATPSAIVQAWMDSPGHRANILNGAYREIGLGVAYDAPVDGGWHPAGTYATDFGARG